LGYVVDHAPVTVSIQTPMEVIHEIFVRLGVSLFPTPHLKILWHYGLTLILFFHPTCSGSLSCRPKSQWDLSRHHRKEPVSRCKELFT
jgi:hypothetical protein